MDPYAPRTNPEARADIRSRLPIRPSDDRYTSLTEVTAWLRARGVSKGGARSFLRRSGCTTVDNIALFLRFQLPPLQFANVDCVNRDMWDLLGVTAGNARRIIVDLDIMHTINLDTNEEAQAHLSTTGLLSQHSSTPATPAAPSPLSKPYTPLPRPSVPQPGPPRVTGLPPAAPHRTSQRSARYAADRPTVPRVSMTSGYQRSQMHAVAEARERPGNGSQGDSWSMSSINWQGIDSLQEVDDLDIDAGDGAAEHEAVSTAGSVPSTVTPSDRTTGSRPSHNGAHAPSPQHSTRSAQSGMSHDGNPMLPAIPAGALASAIPARVATPPPGRPNPADGRVSVDLAPSNAAAPPAAKPPGGAPQAQVLGYPTVSSPLEPGPYHKANAQLRRQLPHLLVEVTVDTRWDHIFLALLAFFAYLTYAGVRLYYLVTGRTSGYPEQNTSVPYSYLVLVAEVFLGALGFYGHQPFWKQDVRYEAMDSNTLRSVSEDVAVGGVRQTVHVLVTTYTEPADTVRECLIRLLVAPEPVYMEKVLYVCDDGHAKSEGPKKRAMVEELRVLGHTNVFYIGDRVKRPGQLNGKSANLNHVVLRKIFPSVRSAAEIPSKDILMVMDCDHMAKPEIFNMMGPCMLDEAVAVTLVPQWFHNLVFPDAFDSANGDFMLSKMPYSFGAGLCFITGTNVMIRARAAFEVCKFANANLTALEDGVDRRQIYAEDEISEDVELGSRMHASGFKSVYIGEKLATGEVPLDLRSVWRQRLRWLKGSHLFILAPGSVFFKSSPHMTLYQKALYWLCPVAHFVQLFFEPVIFTLPFLCLVIEICPYGMDPLLFWTHVAHLAGTFLFSVYHSSFERMRIALSAKGGYRVLWFTSVKACLNTIMVHTGWKKSGHFKFTPKAGVAADEAAVSGALSSSLLEEKSEDGGKGGTGNGGSGEGGDAKAAPRRKPFALSQVHGALSKVTELRRHVMPLDGTLDIWILLFSMGLSLVAAAVGVKRLFDRDALLQWDEGRNGLIWIGVVFALVDATPGLLFLGYAAVYDCAPWLLKIWVPFITFSVAAAVTLIEIRVAYGFTTGD